MPEQSFLSGAGGTEKKKKCIYSRQYDGTRLYLKGKGEEASITSASHGAGRRMSRIQAMANITHNALKEKLSKHNVKLPGGGLDEAPFAYKDIEVVMQSQKALVDVVGKFTPKIVKMCGAETNRIRKTTKKETIEGE